MRQELKFVAWTRERLPVSKSGRGEGERKTKNQISGYTVRMY